MRGSVGLGGDIGYTTVQTRLNRMVKKGIVRRSRTTPAKYSAGLTPDEVSGRDLDLLLEKVSGGRVVPLVAHLGTAARLRRVALPWARHPDIERVLRHIPGFRGYLEKDYRQESDYLLRDFMANRIQKAKRGLDDFMRSLVDQGQIGSVGVEGGVPVDRVPREVDGVGQHEAGRDHVRHRQRIGQTRVRPDHA